MSKLNDIYLPVLKQAQRFRRPFMIGERFHLASGVRQSDQRAVSIGQSVHALRPACQRGTTNV